MAFQAELMIHCEQGFVPRPSLSGLDSDDDDDREADLQYRDVYEFAVGHNASAIAEIDDDCTLQARPDRLGPPRPRSSGSSPQAGRHHARHGGAWRGLRPPTRPDPP